MQPPIEGSIDALLHRNVMSPGDHAVTCGCVLADGDIKTPMTWWRLKGMMVDVGRVEAVDGAVDAVRNVAALATAILPKPEPAKVEVKWFGICSACVEKCGGNPADGAIKPGRHFMLADGERPDFR